LAHIATSVLIVGCSQEWLANELIPEDASNFARGLVRTHKDQDRDYEYVRRKITAESPGTVTDGKFLKLLGLLPILACIFLLVQRAHRRIFPELTESKFARMINHEQNKNQLKLEMWIGLGTVHSAI